jgi:hypothetical protein
VLCMKRRLFDTGSGCFQLPSRPRCAIMIAYTPPISRGVGEELGSNQSTSHLPLNPNVNTQNRFTALAEPEARTPARDGPFVSGYLG